MENLTGPTVARPSKLQIRAQLQRICRSTVFLDSPQAIDLLDYIVNAYIEERAISELDIRGALYRYRKYHAKTSVVRTAKHELNKCLRAYYEGPGRYDPVLIALPTRRNYLGEQIRAAKSTGYIPEIVFNPWSMLGQGLVLAKRHLKEKTPDSLSKAFRALDGLLINDKENIHARALAAEISCVEAVFAASYKAPDSALAFAYKQLAQESTFTRADGTLKPLRAIRSGEQTDKTTLDQFSTFALASAACALCSGKLSVAQDRFDILAEHSPEMLFGGWFVFLLLALGNQTAALKIAEQVLLAYICDPDAYSLYGFVLYSCGDLDGALAVVENGLDCNPNAWILYLVRCLVALERGKHDTALNDYTRMCMLAGYITFEFLPGLGILCQSPLSGLWVLSDAAKESAIAAHKQNEQVAILALGTTQEQVESAEARREWNREKARNCLSNKPGHGHSIQRALIALADDDPDAAINHLKAAWKMDHSPVVWWLKDIRLFDILTAKPEYCELLMDIELFLQSKAETPNS